MAGPDVPDALLYLWQRFVDLDGTRGVSEAGPQPLTYADVRAYADLMDWRPEPHEVAAVMALDRAIRLPDVGTDG